MNQQNNICDAILINGKNKTTKIPYSKMNEKWALNVAKRFKKGILFKYNQQLAKGLDIGIQKPRRHLFGVYKA